MTIPAHVVLHISYIDLLLNRSLHDLAGLRVNQIGHTTSLKGPVLGNDEEIVIIAPIFDDDIISSETVINGLAAIARMLLCQKRQEVVVHAAAKRQAAERNPRLDRRSLCLIVGLLAANSRKDKH